MNLTETRLDVLKLIHEGKHLGDYVPRYNPNKHKGFGAFPVTIAARAARDLCKGGLVRAQDGKFILTPIGLQALKDYRMV